MLQLSIIRDHSSAWLDFTKDDPVRRHISSISRIAHNREVFILHKQEDPYAICCCAYLGYLAEDEIDIFVDNGNYNYATFYTVWSYNKGGGSEILRRILKHIKVFKPFVTNAVTLSPKTDMARNFHTKNGAREVRVNKNTVNFEYFL